MRSCPTTPARVRALGLMIVLAIIAAACTSVTNESAELVLNPDAIAFQADRVEAAASAPAPTQDGDIEFNDEGEQLLQRFIAGSFEADECDDLVDMSELPVQPECGWLVRPLLGSDEFQSIELPVAVFRATGPDPSSTPLIYLHGGPSSSGFLSYLEFEEAFELVVEPYLETRDVIIFDQRGTGLSEPALRCDSPRAWYESEDDEPETFVSRRATRCMFALLQRGVGLDQFSRQSSADDVMVLARELGYQQFDIHGSSWGGILGYTVMQLHPKWVRASVLDSPLSITTDITGSMPASFQEAMNALQANCELSADCVNRHGNIVDRYLSVFDALEEDPLEILVLGIFPILLTADELSYMLFAALYDPDTIALIPDLLRQVENRNGDLVQQLVFTQGWGWGIDFPFLVYMCTDLVPASSPEQVEAQQIGIPAFDRVDDAPDGRGHTAQGICKDLKAEPPGRPTMREVTPTTPTIVFSGSMDPITPFSSGQEIVDTLPNATFVGFNDLAHGVTITDCGSEIALAFLEDPEAKLDLSCSLPENRPIFRFGAS